jgi:hypothetical protein
MASLQQPATNQEDIQALALAHTGILYFLHYWSESPIIAKVICK